MRGDVLLVLCYISLKCAYELRCGYQRSFPSRGKANQKNMQNKMNENVCILLRAMPKYKICALSKSYYFLYKIKHFIVFLYEQG